MTTITTIERSRRILLIEDDHTLRASLRDSLELAGYEVIAAADGLAGWRAFETYQPDLVLVDLDLPLVSGFRLLHLLRFAADPAATRVPIIVTTGYAFEESQDAIVATRPDAYLQKPFTSRQLIDAVGAVLQGSGAIGSPRGPRP